MPVAWRASQVMQLFAQSLFLMFFRKFLLESELLVFGLALLTLFSSSLLLLLAAVLAAHANSVI
jgi:small-conductance mechanosensitive channel